MQHKMRRNGFILCLILLSVFTSVARGQDKKNKPAPPRETSELLGTVRISGAWALYPMMIRWGEEFRKVHPKVRVDISAGGAGKGIADALSGMVDIGMVSREITPEEVKQGGFYIPVVKDAVFPTVNEGNPALGQGLSKKGLKKQIFIDLWIKGKALTWGELAEKGFKDSVRLYTRSDSCGAAETWAQYLGGKKQEDLQGIGVYGDPGLAEAVRKDLFGIGYNNLNYAYDFKTGLPPKGILILPIDVNENGKIDPQEELTTKSKAIQSIVSGSYPSPPARDLYLITKQDSKALTRQLFRWILTEGQKFVEEGGYIKLTKAQVDQALKKVAN